MVKINSKYKARRCLTWKQSVRFKYCARIENQREEKVVKIKYYKVKHLKIKIESLKLNSWTEVLASRPQQYTACIRVVEDREHQVKLPSTPEPQKAQESIQISAVAKPHRYDEAIVSYQVIAVLR